MQPGTDRRTHAVHRLSPVARHIASQRRYYSRSGNWTPSVIAPQPRCMPLADTLDACSSPYPSKVIPNSCSANPQRSVNLPAGAILATDDANPGILPHPLAIPHQQLPQAAFTPRQLSAAGPRHPILVKHYLTSAPECPAFSWHFFSPPTNPVVIY